MTEISESRIECELFVGTGIICALLHLVEIRYNERITFWNGVLRLTDDQARKVGVGQLPIAVKLSDGRTSFLLPTHWKDISGYFEIAGVGRPD
jgi:hypothetical protein